MDHEERFTTAIDRALERLETSSDDEHERLLQLSSLQILEALARGGGIAHWYYNPSGADWRRTVTALTRCGLAPLATELEACIRELEIAFGPRDRPEAQGFEQLRAIRPLCRRADAAFEQSFKSQEFHRAVADWAELIQARTT